MEEITLIIEKSGVIFFGRVLYKQNLVVCRAKTMEKLEQELKKALFDFHEIPPKRIKFRYKYDLSSLFDKFSYLKISTIAKIADINASLLRQYVTGQKHASKKQADKIQSAIHKIAKELLAVEVSGK